ncbi:hypothetical protein ACI2KR_08120 [Pseudomonas luteola]
MHGIAFRYDVQVLKAVIKVMTITTNALHESISNPIMILPTEDSHMPLPREKPNDLVRSAAYESAKARLAARQSYLGPDLSAAYEAEMAMSDSAFACKHGIRKKQLEPR